MNLGPPACTDALLWPFPCWKKEAWIIRIALGNKLNDSVVSETASEKGMQDECVREERETPVRAKKQVREGKDDPRTAPDNLFWILGLIDS